MRYFVLHESRCVWCQVESVPAVDDGLVGECDEPRFLELLRDGYKNVAHDPKLAVLHLHTYTIAEDPDPWT